MGVERYLPSAVGATVDRHRIYGIRINVAFYGLLCACSGWLAEWRLSRIHPRHTWRASLLYGPWGDRRNCAIYGSITNTRPRLLCTLISSPPDAFWGSYTCKRQNLMSAGSHSRQFWGPSNRSLDHLWPLFLRPKAPLLLSSHSLSRFDQWKMSAIELPSEGPFSILSLHPNY